MAYMLGERGPFPHLSGELVGNYNPSLPPGPFNSESEASRSLPDWTYMRVGRPCPTARASSSELQAEGCVGVYLKCNRPLPAGAVLIPTPDWMKEPPASC